MKKLIGSVAIAAMVAGAAFAEIGIGAWGRGVWMPVSSSGNEIFTRNTTSWGGVDSGDNWSNPRAGIGFHAASENVGFNLDYNGDGGTPGVHDNAHLWAKPVDAVKITLGKYDFQTYRQNGAYGLFNWFRIGGGTEGEGLAMEGAGTTGAVVEITPVEGLAFAAAMPSQNIGKEAYKVYMWESTYIASYTMADTFQIKAQWKCAADGTNEKKEKIGYGKIQAAFDLFAVENLYLTVGASIPTAVVNEADPIVAAYARYNMDALTFHVLGKFKLPNSVKNDDAQPVKKGNLGFIAGFGVDYDFGNSYSLNADVRYSSKEMVSGSNYGDDAVVFLVGLNKALTNGKCGIGFEGGAYNVGPNKYEGGKSNDTFTWAIPVVIEMFF